MKALLTLIFLLSLVSCQSDNSSSPISGGAVYPVSLSMGGYTVADNFKHLFINEAHAAVSDFRVCFKRLRFKNDVNDTSTVNDNIDLALGEVSLSASGTALATVSVPAGTYYRIEFDLEPTCAGKSINLANDFGVFNSTETMTIRFDGTFIVDGTENLQLHVQDILNAANAYNGSASLKVAMESVSGQM